jgi:hypothetical protein
MPGPTGASLPMEQDPLPHTPGPQPILIPQRSCYHLHVDLVGPWQYSNNFNYIFTIIDRTSKWMEAVLLSETSAVACAKALTFIWISRFGVPETITSDHGPQFTSNLWLLLCQMLWRACNLTMFHWSSGLACLLPVTRDPGSNPLGELCETRILLLVLSCYIGDPDMIDHHGLV